LPGVHEIPADYRGQDGKLRMRVPGRIIADERLLQHIADDLAPEQVANVASLPGIVGHSLAMPDIHWGYGFPIGGVAAFDPDPEEGPRGVVSPGGVGFDINCGVRLLRTELHVDDVRPRLRALIDRLFSDVPAGMGSRGGAGASDADLRDIMTEGAGWAVENGFIAAREQELLEEGGRIEGADADAVSERARARGRRTLGSLGSGNHFLELQYVDATWDGDAARAFGVHEGQVCIMIHTGSRGLGHQVCQDFLADMQTTAARYDIALVDRQLACAPLGTPEAERYLAAMAAACNFAFANRSVLAARARTALSAIFPGAGDETHVVYDVCHNIAKWEEHRIPPATPDEKPGPRRRLCVHRKGATRAYGPGHADLPARYRDVGQPVIVPGDMGRMSFLLAGSAGAADLTFASSCHGAGRRLSRTAAKKQIGGRELIQALGRQGIIVRAAAESVAAEEAPEAYKDVSEVVDSVELAGLARKVARLRPLGVVKG
jgi:tRNA-splicing ligase RtcB